jgi:hypothetical protein
MNCRERFVYTVMVTFGIGFCIWFTIVTWPTNPVGTLWQSHPSWQTLFHVSQVQAADFSDGSSVTGPPTISADFIDKVLSAYGSPATGTGQALYDGGVAAGIDPVYALAFFLHEDSFGKTGIGAANHSLGNIRCSAGYACQYGFRLYASWEEGYRDWYQLILLGYVQGQITIPIVGHPCRTVEQIIPVYAPSSDNNNVTAYIDAVLAAVHAWRAGSIYV